MPLAVTIVGSGFAGVRAALDLAKNPNHHVTLITDKPDFQYYPTLYSSATGHSHAESWAPLGEIFADHSNIDVFIDEVTHIDASNKMVGGASGTWYPYATLLIAVGVVTSYFGIPGLETYTYGIKNAHEIRRLKQRLFVDIAEKGVLDKNYVIVGAGPTGVELAGALGTYISRLCAHYGVRSRRIKVRLIEAAPRILPRSHVRVSARVAARLKSLGVYIETGKKVEKANATKLIVSGGPIESHTVIWTSGVCNHPLFANHPDIFTLAKNGRVQVDEYMCAYEHIYVLGDNAATPYTGLAQTAIHDARFVAKNLIREYEGKKPRPYRAILPVQAIPVGAGWAVVEWRWVRIYGWVAAWIRRMADLLGYSEVFPLGTSLGSWQAAKVYEDDYFTPTRQRTRRRTKN
jgi:NADH dehydrogenase